MNKLFIPSRIKTLAAIVLLGGASFTQALETDTKKELSVGSSVLVGALIAGPAGAAIGMLTGALLGEQIEAEDQLETAELDMHKAINEIANLEQEINSMEYQLIAMQSEANRLEENLLTRLEFQMLFRTGDDQLSQFDIERVDMLVKYLNRNPELKVRLDGHADQRGTDEYNNLLAKYRAAAVADELIARGIPASRIEAQGHGSSKAISSNGDHEGYALERRVNIEVFNPETVKGVATIN